MKCDLFIQLNIDFFFIFLHFYFTHRIQQLISKLKILNWVFVKTCGEQLNRKIWDPQRNIYIWVWFFLFLTKQNKKQDLFCLINFFVKIQNSSLVIREIWGEQLICFEFFSSQQCRIVLKKKSSWKWKKMVKKVLKVHNSFFVKPYGEQLVCFDFISTQQCANQSCRIVLKKKSSLKCKNIQRFLCATRVQTSDWDMLWSSLTFQLAWKNPW